MATSNRFLIKRESFETWFVDESPLYFGNGIKDIDPKRGLSLNGPLEWSDSKPEPITIRVGIIGTGEGIHEVNQFCKKLMNEISNNNKQPFLRPPFPGMLNVFKCELRLDEKWTQTITSTQVNDILSISAYDLRVKKAAEIYAQKVSNICDKVSRPDVIICHQTEELENKIGASTTSSEKSKGRLRADDRKYYEDIKKKSTIFQILAPLDDDTRNMIDMLVLQDFRRLFKSKCLQYDIPTQILAHSTIEKINTKEEYIEDKTSDEDPATVAWNFAVALYYKSDRPPWRVTTLRSGTCYVGISFYRDQTTSETNIETSLAQIFTDTGEGLVLRGQRFKWENSKEKSPHLTKDAARSLLSDAIDLYKEHKGQSPERIVVHKTSTFTHDELSGFNEARQGIPFHDFLSLSKSKGIYLFRNGDNAPLRGTSVRLNKNNILIFTKGYIPYLRSYPGIRVPRPLQITEHHGDSSPEELVREIIALTRLNWNTASYACYWPMTLQFSRAVGEVLARVPQGSKIQTQYRYYM